MAEPVYICFYKKGGECIGGKTDTRPESKSDTDNTKVTGDKAVQCVAFSNSMWLPISKNDTKPTGDRVKGGIKITIDNNSPIVPHLYNSLTKGFQFEKVICEFYTSEPNIHLQENKGAAKYYTVTGKTVTCTEIKPVIPDSYDPDKKHLPHLVQATLMYDDLEWQHTQGGFVQTDPPAAA